MTKVGKNKTKRKDAQFPLDEKALEASVERKYILERFYDIGHVFANFCLVLMGIELFLLFFLPGARSTPFVASFYWLLWFAISKCVVRYKGTKDAAYGKKLFETSVLVLVPVHEIIQASNDSLASEESRNAHAAMVHLTVYLLGTMNFRLANPRDKSPAAAIILPTIAYNYPRFGIFGPRYEALAFFVAVGLGLLIGSIIDEMRWRHFLLLHKKDLDLEKKSKELSKESRKRAMAMEVLSSYEDKSSFFKIY